MSVVSQVEQTCAISAVLNLLYLNVISWGQIEANRPRSRCHEFVAGWRAVARGGEGRRGVARGGEGWRAVTPPDRSDPTHNTIQYLPLLFYASA